MSHSESATPRRSRGRRAWWIAAALTVLAVGTVWIWNDTSQPALQPITLSDGTVIQFRGATFGMTHTYPDTGLGRRLARVLPQRWRYKVMGQNANMTTTKPILVVWTSMRRPPGAGSNPRFVLGGDAGFAPVPSSSSVNSVSPNGDSIVGWGFDSFPRRGRTITMRIYEPISPWPAMKHGGEFTFLNPARRWDPFWTSEPLPNTRTNDAFEATLRELLVGVSVADLTKPTVLASELESGVRAVLRLTKDGRPTDEWAPVSALMTDPTGNRASSTRWSGQWRSNDFVAGFQPPLWTNEAAWKIRFEFSRQKNFSAEELWTAPPLPLTALSLSNNPAFRTNIQGASLRLLRIRTDNARNQITPDKSSRVWDVTFAVSPDRDDYRLTLVTAVDDQGRDVEKRGSSWGGGLHTFNLAAKTNATHLHLTVALHQSRYEEFRPQVSESVNQ